MEVCKYCKGDGFVMSSRGRSSAPCPFCKGKKKVASQKHKYCIKCGEKFSGSGNYCHNC